MYCKVHNSGGRTVLAASDANIIGKILKFGDVEVHVSEAFYKGEKVDETELERLLDEHSNINLIGEKVVNVALKKGLISERSIIKIQGVPHVQIYRLI